MAANKRKILENAQKYLQKGQLDKALKEYQTLLDLDPRDANTRLKVGDLHLRRGAKGEAIDCYLRVAEQFMKDGFDAKAVALYKQVAKIDESRIDIYQPLAELYQRLGLSSEALAALQTAADAYHREGRKRDALELLRRMATLDPTNTTSRLKIADLLRQADMRDDAVVEYEAVAEELERQGARDQILSVYERILELDPKRPGALNALTRVLVDGDQLQRAEPFARRLVAADADLPEGHELLARILAGLGREDAAIEAYRAAADVYRRRGDEDKARAITQRFLPSDDLSVAGGDPSALLSGSPDDSIASATFASDAEAAATRQQTLDSSGFTGDSEQLLAEASVYLRYGKAERAIATLEALLSAEPDHRPALEKLGEAYSEHGDRAKAVHWWLRAAEVAQGEEDHAAFETLKARIEALDPAAAQSLATSQGGDEDLPIRRGEEAPKEASPPPPSDEMDLEIDLGAPSLDDDSVGEEPGDAFGGDLEVEVDLGELDVEGDAGASAPEPAGSAERTIFLGSQEPSADDSGEMTPDDVMESTGPRAGADVTVFQAESAGFAGDDLAGDSDPSLDSDASLEESDAPVGEEPLQEDADAPAETGSSTTPQQMAEDLEEADFYFRQGLLAEAEGIYARILEAAAGHPQALLRLGEIAHQRGEDPSASGEQARESAPAAQPAAAPEASADDSLGDDLVDWDEVEEPSLESEGEAPIAEDEAAAEADGGSSPEIEVEVDAGRPDDATRPQMGAARAPEITTPSLGELPEEEVEEHVDLRALVDEDDEVEPSAPQEGDAPFDLAAELSDVFESEGEGGAAKEADDGFEAVFREFKRRVKAQLSEQDYETHYDLGIAYREMGLLDDAVGEFRISMGSPERRLSSLHMLGLCALDQARGADAVSHLEQALALPAVPADQAAALRFDLGRAFEVQGDRARALSAYQAVAAFDPDYADVAERLAAFEQGADVAEKEADADPEVERFESFDDLIAEAEADDDAPREEPPPIEPEPVDEAVVEVEPEPADAELDPEPEERPEPKRPPGRRRKRKISYL